MEIHHRREKLLDDSIDNYRTLILSFSRAWLARPISFRFLTRDLNIQGIPKGAPERGKQTGILRAAATRENDRRDYATTESL
jgi:hypothetical protein